MLQLAGIEPHAVPVAALVDRDPTHMSGWDYDPATNRVTFYGPACDSIQSGEVETVSIVFGCPELPPPAG